MSTVAVTTKRTAIEAAVRLSEYFGEYGRGGVPRYPDGHSPEADLAVFKEGFGVHPAWYYPRPKRQAKCAPVEAL